MTPRAGFAQPPGPATSAADREAARNLYVEGFALQQAGNYSDALERFKRAQAVYPAPTTQLHIAECDAQLGHLVEAAEAYRALTRQQLAADANPAFIAAQTQAAAELQQVEPRIPHLHLDVTPHGIPGLSVTVDDQPMNVALLDVDRPVDPGAHKIAVMAPGYFRAEASVTIREREPTKKIVIPMRPTGGVLVPVPPPPPDGAPPPPPPPPEVVVPPPPIYVPEYQSRSGLFFGPRLGGLVPEGASSITDFVTSGFSLGGELDLRFARRLFFGAVVDHAFLGGGGAGGSAATTNVGATFGVIVNPDHVSALFQVGIGYRVLSFTNTVQLPGVLGGVTEPVGQSVHSPEGMLGGGVWIPIGHRVRLVPRIDVGFGSFDLASTVAGSPSESSTYGFINFNLAGYYNLDFGHPPAPPPPSQ